MSEARQLKLDSQPTRTARLGLFTRVEQAFRPAFSEPLNWRAFSP
jgi:hypothetical protein